MACRYGIDKIECTAANDTLVRIGYDHRLNCRRCDLDDASRFVTAEYHEQDDKGKRRIQRWLSKMQLDPSLLDQQPALTTGFKCPIIKDPISVPCSLSKCGYHIDYPWSANCLLAYMHQQGNDTLAAEEIAYLFQFPIDHVKHLIDDATSALRAKAIDQHVEEEAMSRVFTYYITDQVCCVCESAVDPSELNPSLCIDSIGAVYCSKECREEKPPRLVELEVDKGMPIGKILDWTFRYYRSLSLAEQALGIPRWLAYESSRRFLTRPLDSYFPGLASIQKHRRTMLIRRTWKTPIWLNSMMERARPVSKQIVDRFGPGSVSIAELRRRLHYLLHNL